MLEHRGDIRQVDTIKRGLLELNSELIFDAGGNLNIYHPRIDEWMGIRYRSRHIGTLDRGPSVPEFTSYLIARTKAGAPVTIPMEVGWRDTFGALVDGNIPGITWDTLCSKFNFTRKYRMEHPKYMPKVWSNG